jgi:hypothetical protein
VSEREFGQQTAKHLSEGKRVFSRYPGNFKKFELDKVFNLCYRCSKSLERREKMRQIVSLTNNWWWWWNPKEGFIHR